MEYNLKCHFYLKSGKVNSKGQNPVYLRITLNEKRIEISTNQSILQVNWNNQNERTKGNREEIRIFNNYLSSLALKVNRCITDLLNSGEINYLLANDLNITKD